MGTLFSRRHAEPVGIEFALDLTAHTVTLFERAPVSGWKRFAAAELDDPEFPIVIGLLRSEAEAHAGARTPVRIWLPSDQVLRKRAPIDGDTPEARLSAAFDFVARETVYRPEDVAIAVAPEPRGGLTTILITFAETWHEAREYVERWGFLPGIVSTRVSAVDFGVEGPAFRRHGQPIALDAPRTAPTRSTRVLPVAMAASLALVVAGGALSWAYYPQIRSLVGIGAPSGDQAGTTNLAETTTTAPSLSAPTGTTLGATSNAGADPSGTASNDQLALQAPTTEDTPPQDAPTESTAEPVDQTDLARLDADPSANERSEPQRLAQTPPSHVATVPTLAPRDPPVSMPERGGDLGPGLLTQASFSAAPAGPGGRIEAADRPSAPPGPALPDPKLSDSSAWKGLGEPAEANAPLPKLAALDLTGEASPKIAHDATLAALTEADPLEAVPATAPSLRPAIGMRDPAGPAEISDLDLAPARDVTQDPRPEIEVAELVADRPADAGALPLTEPPEPGDGTKFAAKFAPLPPVAPGRPAVAAADVAGQDVTGQDDAGQDDAGQDGGGQDIAEPDTALDAIAEGAPTGEQTIAAARPPGHADLEAPSETAASEPDLTEALAGLDITVMPDLDEARAALPFPPPAPNRAPAAAQADAESGVEASATTPPEPMPDGDATDASSEILAAIDQDAVPETGLAPAAPADVTAPEIRTPDADAAGSQAPLVAAPDAAPENRQAPAAALLPADLVPADLLASLDVTVEPDLETARASLPFPPPAPGRAPVAEPATGDIFDDQSGRGEISDDVTGAELGAEPGAELGDDVDDATGTGPVNAVQPRRRPAHLTLPSNNAQSTVEQDPAPAPAPAPAATGSPPVEITGTDPRPADQSLSEPEAAWVASLLPNGALKPGVEADPDAPTRFASLSSPKPSERPALPRSQPSLPAVNALRLPKLSPGSVREAATDRGLPLDQVALIGILDLDSGRKALLRLPDGRYRSVITGDTIDGWRVSLIGVDAMRVTRSGQDQTLLLVNR